MPNIRDKYPGQYEDEPMAHDPPEKYVRLRMREILEEGRREFTGQAYDDRLPYYDAMVARFTASENESLDHALIFARSLRAALSSPDSPLQGHRGGTLRELVLRVRKEIVDSKGDSVISPSRTQLSPTLESLLSALQGSS